MTAVTVWIYAPMEQLQLNNPPKSLLSLKLFISSRLDYDLKGVRTIKDTRKDMENIKI
jgi:hypothetical protein